MATKRNCDACGGNKDLKNGKTCEKGHFICYSCHRHGVIHCPICKTKLK